MVDLKGSLQGVSLSAITQLIGELRHTGSLVLSRDTSHASLGFEDGRLIAADFEDLHGLAALSACAFDLADADFTFVEGHAAGERTIDLGPAEVQRHLARIAASASATTPVERSIDLSPAERQRHLARMAASAESAMPHGEARAPEAGQVSLLPEVCPRLGFADDPSRHYARPTALHRCFAGATPGLISTAEQRELCLGGGYPACPRFRDAGRLSPLAVVRRDVQLPVASGPAHADAPEPEPAPVAAGSAPAHLRPRVLIACGAALGVVALVVGLLVVVPNVRRAPADQAANGAVQSVAAAPTLAPTPVVGARVPNLPTPEAVAAAPATAAPATPAPAAPAAAAPATPLAPASVTGTGSAGTGSSATPGSAAAAGSGAGSANATSRAGTPAAGAVANDAGPALVDVRFAAGPVSNWLDNPPYATWRDGAYRVQAAQPTRFVAIGVPLDRALGDVVVSATFRKTGGPPGGGYGLLVRDQGPEPRDGVNQTLNAYVFEAGDLGEFGVWRRDGDHWVDLVPWTASETVRRGGSPNDLTVRAIGQNLTFVVNGTPLALIEDDSLASGGVGLFVGGDYNEVALDRYSVQAPE